MEYYPYLYVILSIQPTTNNAMITTILYVSKKVYNDWEETKPTKTTAHSPREPMGSPTPRVFKDKNLPDLVPINTSDGKNEGDT